MDSMESEKLDILVHNDNETPQKGSAWQPPFCPAISIAIWPKESGRATVHIWNSHTKPSNRSNK